MCQVIQRFLSLCAMVTVLLLCAVAMAAELELTVVNNGKTDAVIVLGPEATTPTKTAKGEIIDPWAYNQLANSKRNAEWMAAIDLAKYIGLMTGATPRIAGTREEIDAALIEHGAVGAIAQPLFTTYVVPFEITGILLLVAVVGALVLAKRKVS